MSVLALAAVTALAAQCAPAVAAPTIIAMARTESGLNPLILHDNSVHLTSSFETQAGAAAYAAEMIRLGHSVDLGLMQINSGNLDLLGLSLTDAFDACHSIAAGARLLESYSRYNTGSPTRGFANGYVARVVQQTGAVPPPSPPTTQPPCKDDLSYGWHVVTLNAICDGGN